MASWDHIRRYTGRVNTHHKASSVPKFGKLTEKKKKNSCKT